VTLTDRVKAEARRLGFSLVGVTTPGPPPHFPFYQNWLAAGFHGQMGYLETDRAQAARADPRQLLPECESILVLGVPYTPARVNDPGEPRTTPEGDLPLQGRVAAYAWGDDYHDVLKPRLAALVRFIEAETGQPIPNRWYTDTGPILERDLAQRAGLGWIGKNTCLINPRAGSYFLLAEILLGIQLDLDPAFTADHCGSCTRCIDACPTACILPGRTLDATRCISYLTIELKGPIPADLRHGLGDWIFGCDICQTVCPWNERFAPEQGDPAFAPRPFRAQPELIETLALSGEAFNQRFTGTPILRTKRRGYLRNAAVALGNLGDPRALPALRLALGDAEPLIRAHAAWAIGQIGGEASHTLLAEALALEENLPVREEITAALRMTPVAQSGRGSNPSHDVQA